VELLAGDPEAAERELAAGYEILAEVGARGLLAGELARALVAQDRYEDASQYVAIAEDASGGGDLAPQILWRCAKARIAAAAGDDGAVALADEAVRLAEATDALPLVGDAHLDAALVRDVLGRDSRDSAERASRTYARKGHTVGERAAAALAGVSSARRSS
jgi:hypothetical protein